MLNLTEPYSPFSTTTFTFLVIRLCQNFPATFYYHTKIAPRIKGYPDIPHHTCPHNTQRNQRIKHPWLSSPTYPSGKLQYQSSFYKPKTYKDMEEKTLFKLARAITDTGTVSVPSEGGTVTYRITSLKRKLVNGKVVSTSTPSCTLGSASVSWAIWGGVTVGNGYLDVKINYSENTGSSRSTTLIFDQNGSDNKINLTATQESGVKLLTANITISVSKSPTSNTSANCDIRSDQLVASNITFRLQIQYGVSSGDVKEYIYTLVKGSAISRNNFAIQNGANLQIVDYGYSPQEDSKYIYSVTII